MMRTYAMCLAVALIGVIAVSGEMFADPSAGVTTRPLTTGPTTDAAIRPSTTRPSDGEATFFDARILRGIRHVVFVADRSESMAISENGDPLLNTVKKQMGLAIGQLNDKQNFHVIFYSSGKPLELDGKALVPATERNKEKAAAFVEKVSASGRTNPLPALERAVEVLNQDKNSKGKQMCLLTDGDFSDIEAVTTYIMSNCKGIIVHVYVFGDESHPTIRDAMKKTAKMTGGTFKVIGGE